MNLGSRTRVRSLLARVVVSSALLPLLALASCSSAIDGPPNVDGELGVGTFYFTCNPSAVVCPKAEKGQERPSVSLARHGRVRIRFQRTKSSVTGDTVRAVSPSMLAESVDDTGLRTFEALEAGSTTIAAMSGANELIDFAVVGIADPARMDFTGPDGAYERNVRKLSLRKGSTTRVSAVLFDAYDVTLAGDVAFTFATSSSDVANPTVVDERTVEIEAVEIGTTKLVVDGGGLERVLDLEVTP